MVFPEIATILSGIAGFVMFFNRNPKRNPPKLNDIVVSPADGKLCKPFKVSSISKLFGATSNSIKKLDKDGPHMVIPINLSLMDVHVTRSPCRAKVIDVIHQKGRFLPAICKSALEKNQRNIIVMKSKGVYFAVVQSTGALARRVRCWVAPGESVATGQTIGRILLGSNTSLIIPVKHFRYSEPYHKRVRAGETIIGVIKKG
ncbi:MAG: phosphatidylserine decarboxylase [Candidatus Aenigmatarchaeota archaeon]|nr:phosphatidylserine decarboxylase [Candidatus Aenigmarchaeota archaeon]